MYEKLKNLSIEELEVEIEDLDLMIHDLQKEVNEHVRQIEDLEEELRSKEEQIIGFRALIKLYSDSIREKQKEEGAQ